MSKTTPSNPATDEPVALIPDPYERCDEHLRKAVAILDLLTTITDKGDDRAVLELGDFTLNTTLYTLKHLVQAAQKETEHWLRSLQGEPS